ncbi:hypothetical protein [Deinococcus murrayi]|uniref:hypothetical protein n=1 Tax=Deinococcus murrayi TaxID=68910 RepID=UPI0012F8DE0F|nr:hypothetical protein [Deinococcus murrayi]
MARPALRWLEALCLGTPLLLALSAALAAHLGVAVDWQTDAVPLLLGLPVLALLWWAARAATLVGAARAVTWAGILLTGQALLAGVLTLLEPGRPPAPHIMAALMLALSGSVGTFLALLPGLGLLALGAVLHEVAALIQDEELTV